jgi:hypothetical protein
MGRSCIVCQKPLTTTNVRARYCSSTCRARRSKGLVTVTEDGPQALPTVPDAPSVYAATRAELEDAGRLSTVLGAKVLALAARIDAGVDTGAALARLVQQHDTTMALALDGARSAADPVDHLLGLRVIRGGA